MRYNLPWDCVSHLGFTEASSTDNCLNWTLWVWLSLLRIRKLLQQWEKNNHGCDTHSTQSYLYSKHSTQDFSLEFTYFLPPHPWRRIIGYFKKHQTAKLSATSMDWKGQFQLCELLSLLSSNPAGILHLLFDFLGMHRHPTDCISQQPRQFLQSNDEAPFPLLSAIGCQQRLQNTVSPAKPVSGAVVSQVPKQGNFPEGLWTCSNASLVVSTPSASVV